MMLLFVTELGRPRSEDDVNSKVSLFTQFRLCILIPPFMSKLKYTFIHYLFLMCVLT